MVPLIGLVFQVFTKVLVSTETRAYKKIFVFVDKNCRNSITILRIVLSFKGQLISEWNFGVFKPPKKPTKISDLASWGRNLVGFGGDLKKPKFHSKINWPLDLTFLYYFQGGHINSTTDSSLLNMKMLVNGRAQCTTLKTSLIIETYCSFNKTLVQKARKLKS